MRYVGALDQGTTSTRFAVFDRAGALVASAQREHRQIYPRPGWVEHDPAEIWEAAQGVIVEALADGGLAPRDLAAFGIANQRETTLLWERATGRPVHNALVWQDTRTDRLAAELARAGGTDRFRDATGLPLASYFSALKLRWLLDAVPGLRMHVPTRIYSESDRIGVFPFTLNALHHARVAAILEHEYGIEVRAGTICNHRLVRRWFALSDAEQEAVEERIAAGDRLASYGIVRASLGIQNGRDDIDALAEALTEIATSGAKLDYRPMPAQETYEPV